jgi:hypothetical protein
MFHSKNMHIRYVYHIDECLKEKKRQNRFVVVVNVVGDVWAFHSEDKKRMMCDDMFDDE